MPTTFPQGFIKLSQNLEITALQESTVSKRQEWVRQVVAKEMHTLDDFLTGSYRRSTMIAPLSQADIDIFVVLDPRYFETGGHASLLDKVKRALAKTFTTSVISRDGQAVTISFKDFKVDVVPGFDRTGGGYLIPDSVGRRWIETDPKKHVELWSKMNALKNGDFIKVIKMLKQWNRAHSQILQSFHLEVLAYNVFLNVTITDHWSGVRYFFDHARKFINSGILDPAGYGGDVGAYLSTKQKSEVLERLNKALKQAQDAESFADYGKIQEAYMNWIIIFGDYFPAYF